MPWPVLNNCVDKSIDDEDTEEDLETPTAENIFPEAKVRTT